MISIITARDTLKHVTLLKSNKSQLVRNFNNKNRLIYILFRTINLSEIFCQRFNYGLFVIWKNIITSIALLSREIGLIIFHLIIIDDI